MKILQKRITLLAACAVLVFGVGPLTAFAAQSKAKTSKNTTAGEQKTSTTIDLNTASEEDLDSLPGVGPATAKKIIAGRPYSSVDALSEAGVSAATIKKITPLVTVSGGTAAVARTQSDKKPGTPRNVKDAAPAYQPEPSPATSKEPAPAPPAKTASPSTSQGSAGPGTVWVNLDSGVYHFEGTRYYGKTKNGKYMSEADAVKSGYHPAKNEKKQQ